MEKHANNGLPEEITIAFVRLAAAPGSQEAIGVVSSVDTTEWLTGIVFWKSPNTLETIN